MITHIVNLSVTNARAGALKRIEPNNEQYNKNSPPWLGDMPDMETYEQL